VIRILAACFALVLTSLAHANTTPVAVKDVQQYLAEQQKLRVDLDKSKRFKHVDGASKRKILAAQDVLFRMLKDKRSVDELNPDERTTVFNADSEIVAILTDAENDRPICENRPKIGSHMRQMECISKAQREKDREETQRFLLGPRNCSGPMCGDSGGG